MRAFGFFPLFFFFFLSFSNVSIGQTDKPSAAPEISFLKSIIERAESAYKQESCTEINVGCSTCYVDGNNMRCAIQKTCEHCIDVKSKIPLAYTNNQCNSSNEEIFCVKIEENYYLKPPIDEIVLLIDPISRNYSLPIGEFVVDRITICRVFEDDWDRASECLLHCSIFENES